ncbi:CBS domain-containing protein [Streptomyces alboflavus]|uniref:CBS domain-containing protein n=1 Tax=Streptomyces alboflavus TaxID=67267 RepID=A0A1Z1WPG2_9ACTN|nr:CBS domain-containing protein [Streptomyces alboflavus]ARX88289.1 hypothetical protein SMD44_07776 [Streptomyces alboflavus]
MRARDLLTPYPAVSVDDEAMDALRLVSTQRLPALLVVDSDGRPYAIVAVAHLVGRLVPDFVRQDPVLAAVIGDRFDVDARESAIGTTIGAWLPHNRVRPPVVGPDAAPMQIAALLDRTQSPLVVVIEQQGDTTRLLGAVTPVSLLDHFVRGS